MLNEKESGNIPYTLHYTTVCVRARDERELQTSGGEVRCPILKETDGQKRPKRREMFSPGTIRGNLRDERHLLQWRSLTVDL